MLTMKRTPNKRRLNPAGYAVLGVIAVLALATVLTIRNWVDEQIIHPYGHGIPSSFVVTSTPTPTVAATTQRATPTSGLNDLLPLVTVTPPDSPPKATGIASATATRPAGIPWAGKVAPGKLLAYFLSWTGVGVGVLVLTTGAAFALVAWINKRAA